jgi:hypothetical protein
VAGHDEDALEVDAIARAHRQAAGAGEGVMFWEDLRARHLDPIRTSVPTPPQAAAVTDLPAARDRALALADAAAAGH